MSSSPDLARGSPASGRSTAVAPSLLREMNQRLLLDHLLRGGPATRPQLARDSGLSQPTVIAALDGLERAGLVLARSGERAQLGRPARLYSVNPGAGTVAAVDIGRGWLHVRIADLVGTTLGGVDTRNQASSAAALVDLTARSLSEALHAAGLDGRPVTHTAIASPGVLDPRRGGVRYATNLPGWHQAGLAQALVERIGPSVSIDNDANLAALAELHDGAARGLTDFAYLTVGTGVGVGLVLDGRIYRGVTGAAGEVGYLPIGDRPPSDPRRARGMFEDVVAADAVVRYAREAGVTGRMDAERVYRLARGGQPEALAAVGRQGRQLGLAVASIAAFLDPEVVVMGGPIGQNVDLLEPVIAQTLRQVTPMRPRLVAGELGAEAVVHGAVVQGSALAREALFAERLLPAR